MPAPNIRLCASAFTTGSGPPAAWPLSADIGGKPRLVHLIQPGRARFTPLAFAFLVLELGQTDPFPELWAREALLWHSARGAGDRWCWAKPVAALGAVRIEKLP